MEPVILRKHTATAEVEKLFQNKRNFVKKFREIEALIYMTLKLGIFALFD